MKTVLSSIGVMLCLGLYAQLPISVFDCSIIDPTVTQQEIDDQDNYFKQCILFEDVQNYSFGNDDTKEVTALEVIHIEKDFHSGAFSSS